LILKIAPVTAHSFDFCYRHICYKSYHIKLYLTFQKKEASITKNPWIIVASLLSTALSNVQWHCGEIACLKGLQGVWGYPV